MVALMFCGIIAFSSLTVIYEVRTRGNGHERGEPTSPRGFFLGAYLSFANESSCETIRAASVDPFLF